VLYSPSHPTRMKPLQAAGSVLALTYAFANAVCNAKSTAKLLQLAPNPALKECRRGARHVSGADRKTSGDSVVGAESQADGILPEERDLGGFGKQWARPVEVQRLALVR
jgi:hypothetical protein